MTSPTPKQIFELNGNLGINGSLYRELYRRALVLVNAPNRSFSDGSVGRMIYGVMIEREPSGAMRIDHLGEEPYPIPRLVLAVDRYGRIQERMLADARTLREVLDLLKRNMVLDDLANA